MKSKYINLIAVSLLFLAMLSVLTFSTYGSYFFDMKAYALEGLDKELLIDEYFYNSLDVSCQEEAVRFQLIKDINTEVLTDLEYISFQEKIVSEVENIKCDEMQYYYYTYLYVDLFNKFESQQSIPEYLFIHQDSINGVIDKFVAERLENIYKNIGKADLNDENVKVLKLVDLLVSNSEDSYKQLRNLTRLHSIESRLNDDELVSFDWSSVYKIYCKYKCKDGFESVWNSVYLLEDTQLMEKYILDAIV